MDSYLKKIFDFNRINQLCACDIYIYGAGSAGLSLWQLLEGYSKILQIKGFIDTYKSGFLEDKPIVNINSYDHHSNSIILIASYAKNQIIEKLVAIGIYDFYIVDEFWTLKYMFNINDRKSYDEDVNEICSFLYSESDKALYRLLYECRTHGSKLSRLRNVEGTDTIVLAFTKPNLLQDNFPEHTKKQYLDFIDADAVKFVVQAGVYDGSDIIELSHKAKNLCRIYGFEPLGTDLMLPQVKDLIKQEKVIIESKALYEKATTINFFPNKAGSYISNTMASNGNEYCIETISLDEYCDANNIEKLDLIICDIENAEIDFLKGATSIIRRSRPQLAISIYHSKEQFIEIPLLLHDMLENYSFRIGHYSHTLNETAIYAIPSELIPL